LQSFKYRKNYETVGDFLFQKIVTTTYYYYNYYLFGFWTSLFLGNYCFSINHRQHFSCCYVR